MANGLEQHRPSSVAALRFAPPISSPMTFLPHIPYPGQQPRWKQWFRKRKSQPGRIRLAENTTHRSRSHELLCQFNLKPVLTFNNSIHLRRCLRI